ncbi:hypothetical protein MKQ68_19990 [Chitinophaga horti]|uniref:Uncharacterized protein n=1 Tax=Chitinophaga horti TaxID=2920382 RepID=A0ABY6J245_9BACT|nr:hypothetical protein [Chitinophaga horti]UYQ92369.1 hypothetical protein MKQ68_19990 [Chitinophaga horti]
MKRTLIFCMLLCVRFTTHAQFTTIAEGADFKEPEQGFARILQFKGGNTMYLQFSLEGGIDIHLYDAAHKLLQQQSVTASYGKLERGSIDAVFESNGNATLLVSEIEDKAPVLHRLIINGATAQVERDEKLLTLNKLTTTQFRNGLLTNTGRLDFFIENDPRTGDYAIVKIDPNAAERMQQMEVMHYSAAHQELNRAFFNTTDSSFREFGYWDMVVNGSDKVILLGRASRGESKDRELVMATMAKGNTALAVHPLKFPVNLEAEGVIMKYNPVTAQYIVVAAGANKRERFTYLGMAGADMQAADSAKLVFPEKASEKSMELFGKKRSYEGVPQDLFINRDGSFSLVWEELEDLSVQRQNGMMKANTNAGNIAVVMFDKSGRETSSYFIPKKHYLPGVRMREFSHASRGSAAQMITSADTYKTFSYVEGGSKPYILLNDSHENTEKAKTGKLSVISDVAHCDAFYYALGNDIMPDRSVVLDAPGKNNIYVNNIAMFSISAYDAVRNIYVTVKIDDGNRRVARLVWMTPE